MSIELIAYETIKKRLLLGDLEQDYFYSEASLSKDMNISRSPVRYALKQLESDGLITYHKNKGVKVRRASSKEISECLDVVFIFLRVVLEKFEKGTISFDFKLLYQTAAEARENRSVSDIYEYIRNIYLIYEYLIASLNNETIVSLVQRLSLRMMATTIYSRISSYRTSFESKRVNSITQLYDLIVAIEANQIVEAWAIFHEYEDYTRRQYIQSGSLL